MVFSLSALWCSLGISSFLEEISSLSHSVVFLYFFALITEEGFLISPCYSLEQACLTQWNYEPCYVGPPKLDGSWWRVLTKHGPLEKGMANHFRILAWRIQGTGDPGGLPSMGSHRVRHDWSNLAAAAEISSRKLEIPREHFMQRWARRRTEMVWT